MTFGYFEILCRGDSTSNLRKTINKSAKIVDSKESLFEKAKDKTEYFNKRGFDNVMNANKYLEKGLGIKVEENISDMINAEV